MSLLKPQPLTYWGLHTFAITCLLAWLAWSVQHNAIDVNLSHYFYDATQQVFPLQHQWFVEAFGRFFIWMVPFGGACLWAAMAYRSPSHSTQRYGFVLLACLFVASPLGAGVLKQFTAMPRPILLDVFGGDLAMPTRFWVFDRALAGGALPSVHATSGYVLLGFYFLGWGLNQPWLRWSGLALGLLAGFVFGWLRIMQGYHFLSQTMWSLAFVWLVANIVFYPLLARQRV